MTAEELTKKLLENDRFSQWLGFEIEKVESNYCLIKMIVRLEMMNGLGTLHGGVTFSLAESALAIASNNTNEASVALQCSISFTKPIFENEIIIADCRLVSATKKTAIYDISLAKTDGVTVALFRGTVYKIGKKMTDL